jgi:hypothetical protein
MIRAEASITEEPDAGTLHVRVCGGRPVTDVPTAEKQCEIRRTRTKSFQAVYQKCHFIFGLWTNVVGKLRDYLLRRNAKIRFLAILSILAIAIRDRKQTCRK